MRILIIEDHSDIAANIGDYLEATGHQCDFAFDGKRGVQQAMSSAYDAIILDVNLPFKDGFTVCRELREADVETPVLMLSARGGLSDKLHGFEVGAWDYVVKPFALKEIDARINALALRQNAGQPKRLVVGSLVMSPAEGLAWREGREIKLHQASWQILETLMRASPKVVSRQELEYRLWGDELPASDPLRSHIYEIRKHLDKPFANAMLETVHGVGYRLVADD